MNILKVIKSIPSQSVSIAKMSYGDYRVIHSSTSKGYTVKDFDTLEKAEGYANKRANLLH